MFLRTFNNLYKWILAGSASSIKKYSTSTTAMKVTVIGGTGKVARPLCLLLKQSSLIDELCIHDIEPTDALVAELNHVDTNCKVEGFSGVDNYEKALHNTKVAVVVAAAPDVDLLSADKTWSANAPIVQDIVTNVAKYASKAILAIATNPINSLIPMTCEILKKRAAFNPNTVFGITTLDTVRANTFAARVLGLDPECVMVPVVGGNTENTMVPVLSATKPSPEYTLEEIESITVTVRKARENMLKLKPPTNGHFANAFACARFVISLVKAIRGYPDVIECAYVPSKSHPDVNYLSTPLLLGPGGIARNLGIPKLSAYESCLLDNAIMYLRNDIQSGEKFVCALHTAECDPCDIQIPRCPQNWCDTPQDTDKCNKA